MTLKIDKSMKLYHQALQIMPAGVGSNSRLWRSGICPIGMPCAIFVSRAKGAYLWDVDNNKYIDYRLGYGPVILGHDYDPVSNRVHHEEHLGAVYAAGHELEIKVARKVISLIPSADMIRFSSTGTEATMNAIRIARAATKKDKILKFEGHFHGTHDYLLWSTEPPFSIPQHAHNQEPFKQSWGIPDAIKKLILVERWNQFDAIERTIKENHQDLAAIITEPIMGNAASIMPKPGYLKHLRELCTKYGVLLIFDEVKTGFRADLGGAQKLFRVTPDITTIAKSMGNGFPVSAIVGKREYMSLIGPGMVAHGGTYSSNPVSLAAVDATIDALKRHNVIEHIRHQGTRLMKGISQALDDKHVPHQMLGIPGMFQIAFTTHKTVEEWRDLQHCDLKLYPYMHQGLLEKGVMTDADIEEPMFLSYSHGPKEIEKTIEAYANCCGVAYKKIGKRVKRL